MSSVTELYEARLRKGALTPDPAQRAVLPVLDRVVARLAKAPPAPAASSGWRAWFGGKTAPAPSEGPRGLYLWGGVGRGKSMLMDLLAEAAPISRKRRVHFHAFMQEVQSGLDQARRAGAQDAVRPVAQAIARDTRLLCFDEMQITDIADAMIVGRLFQILFEEGVQIVTTSNRIPEDLYKNGLNRQLFLPFIALIRDRMEVVELASPRDHRQDRLTGAPVWFCPLGPQARAEMDGLWADLTRHQSPAPCTLTLGTRRVEIGEAAGTTHRASFATLCARALGPADYLALAARAEILLIDDIPLLSRENFNEAKRFVTLIDALYEARVRVIASAEAEPEALFRQGEGAFEFERTASRLREMQDAKWGQGADDA